MSIYDQIAQSGNRLAPVSSFIQGQQAGQRAQANRLAMQASQQRMQEESHRKIIGLLDMVEGAPATEKESAYQYARNYAIQNLGADAGNIPEQYDPRFIQATRASIVTPRPQGMPSSVREYQYYTGLNPDQQKTFIGLKRAAPMTPEQIAQRAAARIAGKEKGKAAAARPKVEAKIKGATEKTMLLDDLIGQAKDQAGFFTTGFIGQKLSGIGSTDAHDLQNTLNTIKANIGFDRLQEMRDNSPTGGALGQVSQMENELLQAVWSSLAQSQSEEQLKENLERVRKQVRESWKRIAEAYEKDYGVPLPDDMYPGGAGVSSKQDNKTATQAAPEAAIQYLMQNDSPELRQQFQSKYGYLPGGM